MDFKDCRAVLILTVSNSYSLLMWFYLHQDCESYQWICKDALLRYFVLHSLKRCYQSRMSYYFAIDYLAGSLKSVWSTLVSLPFYIFRY